MNFPDATCHKVSVRRLFFWSNILRNSAWFNCLAEKNLHKFHSLVDRRKEDCFLKYLSKQSAGKKTDSQISKIGIATKWKLLLCLFLLNPKYY